MDFTVISTNEFILFVKSILVSKLKYNLYCCSNKISQSKINSIRKRRRGNTNNKSGNTCSLI